MLATGAQRPSVPAGLPCLAQADEVIGGEAGHGPADLAVVGRAPCAAAQVAAGADAGSDDRFGEEHLARREQPSTSGAVQPEAHRGPAARCSGAVRRPASSCCSASAAAPAWSRWPVPTGPTGSACGVDGLDGPPGTCSQDSHRRPTRWRTRGESGDRDVVALHDVRRDAHRARRSPGGGLWSSMSPSPSSGRRRRRGRVRGRRNRGRGSRSDDAQNGALVDGYAGTGSRRR